MNRGRITEAISCFLALLLPTVVCARGIAQFHQLAELNKQSRVIVDEVHIEGGSDLTSDEKALLTDHLRGDSVHEDWLNRLEAKAVSELQNDGFLDGQVAAKIESKQLLQTTEHVTVLLTLSTGARYSIKQIWWTGSSVFSPSQLTDLTLLRVGDTFRLSALRKSDTLLRQAYKTQGYEEASFDAQFKKFPEHGFVMLYIEVAEGKKSEPSTEKLTCKQYSTEEIERLPYVPGQSYDPNVDVGMQMARAQFEARTTHKKLLLILGGEWCGWCRVLEETFQRNPNLSELRNRIFVTVRIDANGVNNRRCALRTYPEPSSFPFVYVLDEAGKLLGVEDTVDWESSDGYDPNRIEKFLQKW